MATIEVDDDVKELFNLLFKHSNKEFDYNIKNDSIFLWSILGSYMAELNYQGTLKIPRKINTLYEKIMENNKSLFIAEIYR